MEPRPLFFARFPLIAALVQACGWLAITGLFTATYTSQGAQTVLTSYELPLTYGLLGISGFAGGGLALIGIYRLLAYSQQSAGHVVLIILSVLSLVWAVICIYALLIFLTAI